MSFEELKYHWIYWEVFKSLFDALDKKSIEIL